MTNEQKQRNTIKDITAILDSAQEFLRENPTNPHLKVSLDIAKVVLSSNNIIGLSEERAKLLKQRYDMLRTEYDSMRETKKIPDCPWLNDPNYV